MVEMDIDELLVVCEAATQTPWHYEAELTEEEAMRPGGSMAGIEMGYTTHPPYFEGVATGDLEHMATFNPPTVKALLLRLKEQELYLEGMNLRIDHLEVAVREGHHLIHTQDPEDEDMRRWDRNFVELNLD